MAFNVLPDLDYENISSAAQDGALVGSRTAMGVDAALMAGGAAMTADGTKNLGIAGGMALGSVALAPATAGGSAITGGTAAGVIGATGAVEVGVGVSMMAVGSAGFDSAKKKHEKVQRKINESKNKRLQKEAGKHGYDKRVSPNKTPFDSHGEQGFQNKKGDYITRDRDGHNGGVWKKFSKTGKRLGTYNKNMNRIKK